MATAIRENREVVLSKSRIVLRDQIAMWVKEIISDPAICSAHCCKCGFDRAEVSRVLYWVSDGIPDVDSVVPPQCANANLPYRAANYLRASVSPNLRCHPLQRML